MKKYRLTKITVKTREIVSLATAPATVTPENICPVCHSPLSKIHPVGGAQTALTKGAEEPIALPAADPSNHQE
jgi:hypothetical protein